MEVFPYRLFLYKSVHLVEGKKVILGVSGGIAAYKAAFLIRLFKKAGAEVRVVATRNALEFITKVSLESLSGNRVYDEVFSPSNDYSTEHIALCEWGDVFVLAPATANIIGKLASGIADDALSTSLLAFNRQLFVAPAMNCNMYEHFSVKRNLRILKDNGVDLIEPAEGYLACGWEGKGRMQEPDLIFDRVSAFFRGINEGKGNALAGKRILVTAGPTYEDIDPVRYIGNNSSGRMGYAIAAELQSRGAKVDLVSGPVSVAPPENVELTYVRSSEQMHDLCMKLFPLCDAAIMAAAVADYKAEKARQEKIKKTGKTRDKLTLELVPTKDILAEMGRSKGSRVLAGFALETDNEEENARSKLQSKRLDFIVLNSLNDKGAGFSYSTNKITILDNKGEVFRYPLKSKEEAAADIVDKLEKHLL